MKKIDFILKKFLDVGKFSLFYFTVFLSMFFSNNVDAQFCSTTTLSNMGALTPTGTFQNVTMTSGSKRYWTFTATAGCTYDFSTCNSINTNDTYLRLYQGTTPTTAILRAQNDDGGPFCAGNKASLSWLCPTTGTYSILVTNYSCANISSSTVLSHRVTCGTPYNPCTTIPTISACGVSTTANMSGGGAGWSVTSCGFSTPGQERLFQFTPTTTGTYQLNVTAISGGYIDFFWKSASGGCNATGWNCIDDINTTGTYNAVSAMTFTAGTTYYILLDPEGSGTYSATFSLVCPTVPVYNPCTTIPTISACGVATTANMSGSGAGWSSGSCGWTTPGQERIFQFTPTASGVHQLNVTAISGGYIDFFWKASSSGCNATGWNCIDDINVTGTYNAVTTMNLIAGTSYYILLDPEGTGTYSSTFNIVCPPSGCINTNSYGNVTAPTVNTTLTIETCQDQSEFSTISNIVLGNTYQFGYNLGGWITVRGGTYDGTILAAGNAPLTWTATTSGTVFVHYNTNSSCGQDFFCGTSTITCTSCAGPPPTNDLVCNAITILCGSSTAGTTLNASNSGSGENGVCGVSQSQPGVWYVVSGNGQTMTASLCGTVWDSKISVFSGTNCSAITCIGGVDDDGPACSGTPASYTFTTVNGTNYYILVHGYSSSSNFTLNLTCVTPPPANPTSISTSSNFVCAGGASSVILTANGGVGTVYWFTGSCSTTGQIATGNSITVSPSSTTTYYARNFNSGQFSSSCVNTTIEVRTPPTVVAGSNVTICEGNTAQLGATVNSTNTLTVLTGGINGCVGGNMFNVTTNSTAVTITSFDITPNITGNQTVNVYYLNGTYVGNETNSSAWTLLGSYPITGTADILTNLIITPLTIPVGSTYGIYINYDANYSDGSTTVSDSYISVSAGVGLCGLFTSVNTPRTFNGRINYEITPILSWTPSATLSSSTILNPIASPTTTTTYTLTGTANGCQATSTVAVAVNTLSTSPTIAAVPGTICPNTNTTLNATGGIVGTGSTIRWYSSANGGGTLLGTGSSITIPFAETSTVYVRREGTCNNSPDSTRTVNIREFKTITVTSSSTPNYCVDNNGWGHWYNSNDEIIFSVKGDFSMCGSGYPSVTVSRNPTFTFYNQSQNSTALCASNGNPGEMRFEMGRNWNVDFGGATPSGLYSVRFYHLTTEKSEVISAAIDTMNSLTNCAYSYKYSNPNGWFWFKNVGTTYVAPQWDGVQYDGLTGTTVNGVTYVEMDSIPSFSGGSGGVILVPSSIFPIEWKSFMGQNIGKSNKLNWVTATETETDYFELERGFDGINFEGIILVGAAGNSTSENYYNWIDENPLSGVNYYRLKLWNLDGSFEYSNIIALDVIDQNSDATFYPNPTTGIVTYTFEETENDNLQIEIFDAIGKKVLEKDEISRTGLNLIQIDLSDFVTGTYNIRVKHERTGKSNIQMIIKR
jgi:hypothetical protein